MILAASGAASGGYAVVIVVEPSKGQAFATIVLLEADGAVVGSPRAGGAVATVVEEDESVAEVGGPQAPAADGEVAPTVGATVTVK